MTGVIVIACLVLLALLLVPRRRHEPHHRGLPCVVSTEWGGLFIGRRYCSTHQVHWDGGGDCPKAEPI